MIRTLLPILLLAAGPLVERGERKAPPRVGVTRTQLTVMNGVFDIPRGCVAECRFGVDAYSGVVSCPAESTILRYSAGLEFLSHRSPVDRLAVGVQGSDRRGDAFVYWGWSEHAPPVFCASVIYPAVGFGSPPLGHAFCTDSSDQRAQAQAQAVAIVRSFRRAVEGASETCGLPVPR